MNLSKDTNLSKTKSAPNWSSGAFKNMLKVYVKYHQMHIGIGNPKTANSLRLQSSRL